MDRNKFLEKFHRNERVEMLSDGVFAIVLTLLVLELHVPQLGENPGNKQMLLSLFAMRSKILSFLLSFVFVASLWFSHTVFFRLLIKIDNGILWLNNFFLLIVCFIPFPTALTGEYPSSTIAMILFGVPWLLVPLFFYSMGTYSLKKGYVSPLVDLKQFKAIRQTIILFIPMSMVPMILSLISPVISLIIYIGMSIGGIMLGFKVRLIKNETSEDL